MTFPSQKIKKKKKNFYPSVSVTKLSVTYLLTEIISMPKFCIDYIISELQNIRKIEGSTTKAFSILNDEIFKLAFHEQLKIRGKTNLNWKIMITIRVMIMI